METPGTGLRPESSRHSWGWIRGSPETPFPARAQPRSYPVPSPARHSDLFGGHSMFPGNPGHGEVQDAVSGPRSAARPRGQGIWAGPVHPASPGSAKGPTHRAHHDQDQWPWGARRARTAERPVSRRSEAYGVPYIRRPGTGAPDLVHTQCRKVTRLGRAEWAHWGTSIPLGTPGDKGYTCALVVRERLWA